MSKWVADRHGAVRWAMLCAGSIALAYGLNWLGLSAAWLLGPMLAAVLLATAGGAVTLPGVSFRFAQAVIGLMIAGFVKLEILATIAQDWPVFIGCILFVLFASVGLGVLLARGGMLPGTTAIWGALPGGATAITLMAQGPDVDVRLVALMQYWRVIFVAVTASVLARLWVAPAPSPIAGAVVWFPPLAILPFLVTAALAASAAALSKILRSSASALLIGLFVGVLLQDFAGYDIVLPPWLLALSYAVAGWGVGMSFTPAIVAHAARVFPQIAIGTALLVAICGVMAWFLTQFAGIDPLTAYLATSPGGADAIAIISAASEVDLPFVMAMQTGRFVVVLVIAAPLARIAERYVARRSRGGDGQAEVADETWP